MKIELNDAEMIPLRDELRTALSVAVSVMSEQYAIDHSPAIAKSLPLLCNMLKTDQQYRELLDIAEEYGKRMRIYTKGYSTPDEDEEFIRALNALEASCSGPNGP